MSAIGFTDHAGCEAGFDAEHEAAKAAMQNSAAADRAYGFTGLSCHGWGDQCILHSSNLFSWVVMALMHVIGFSQPALASTVIGQQSFS